MRQLFLVGVASMAVASAAPALAADDPAQIAVGKQVYDGNCASCHGANLEGQPNWRQRLPSGRLPAPPHDRTGHTWHHDDATLFAITKYGLAELIGQPYETDMPAYKDVLSDDEIRAVLAYIKSSWPPQIRARQEALNRRAPQRREQGPQ